MDWKMPSPLTRRTLALALVGTALPWATADETDMPPALLRQTLAGATLAGKGQMRFLQLRIYDARLWVMPQFDAHAYERQPLALELTYHRTFSSSAIAQRSIEEIQRQRTLSPAQAERWRQTLADVLPDVQAGDRLTSLYLPAQGMRLWRGNQELSPIQDAELAQLFFGIWLSPRTSEPQLRRALLGHVAKGAQ